MLTCLRCELSLDESAFSVNSGRETGRSPYCRACTKAMAMARGNLKTPGWQRKTEDMASYQKAWRAANKDKIRVYETRRDPAGRNAKAKVKYALKTGRLVRWPCEVCGDKSEAHHPSYDMPLVVVWLCPAHHREAHALTK